MFPMYTSEIYHNSLEFGESEPGAFGLAALIFITLIFFLWK